MKRRYFQLLADLTAGGKRAEIEAQMHRCSASKNRRFMRYWPYYEMPRGKWSMAMPLIDTKFLGFTAC